MKIIAFNGSPRRKGNSESLLLEAVRGTGMDVEVFDLARMEFKPCQNCGGCLRTGACAVKDAAQEIHAAIREADRIIVSTPIFFMGVTAQLKAMIDRCQSFWSEKYLLKRTIPPKGGVARKGLLFIVGGMDRESAVTCPATEAKAFFRTVSIEEHETLIYMNIDARGDIAKHPTALRDAFEAGARLAIP